MKQESTEYSPQPNLRPHYPPQQTFAYRSSPSPTFQPYPSPYSYPTLPANRPPFPELSHYKTPPPAKSSPHVMAEDEMAEMQKLSNEYQPSVEGPAVGTRRSTKAIVDAYEAADPTFVRKTRAMHQQYPQYRPIRGDGTCGWRAIAFGYFEALVRLKDLGKVVSEQDRLLPLNSLLNTFWSEEYVYIDYADATQDLLKRLGTAIAYHQDVGQVLLDSFNNPESSNSIIMYMKMITSAWLRSHSGEYEAFLEGSLSMEEYCQSRIDLFAVEIEHIGINALADILIKPAGMALEILYLDLSKGDEANTYMYAREDFNQQGSFAESPRIRLLYTIGHYDIIYKIEDVAGLEALVPVAPQVNFITTYDTFTPVLHLDYITDSINRAGYDRGVTYHSATPIGYSHEPYQPDNYLDHVSPTPITPITPLTDPMPISSPRPPLKPTESQNSSFRKSVYQSDVEADFIPCKIQRDPCQTAPMKDNGESHAHFANTNFQPEIWEPGAEYKLREKEKERTPQSRRAS